MAAVAVGVALLVGVLAGWFLAGLRVRATRSAVEVELKRQIAEKDAAIAAGRAAETGLVADKATAATALGSSQQQLLEARAQMDRDVAHIERLRAALLSETTGHATSRAELEAARQALADRQTLYQRELAELKSNQEKALADLREAFKALSSEALRQNAPDFLRLAEQSFANLQEAAKGDLAKRQEAIVGLLKPLEEQLRTYQTRLQQTESQQAATLGEVKTQLESLTKQSQTLASETERFRMVLKSNQTRGRWGEETLRRVVEAAGMSVHCDFVEQTAGEDRRPDMIVKLPGDRVIIVDAKVPDLEFLAALDAADITQREQALQAHARKLKETIKNLAARDYPSQFTGALDYVVLFLPAESLFSAALEGDRDLIVWAANNRILLATPASLIALLRSVSVSWLQFDQTVNARQIAEAAKELYDRVAVFCGHFDKIGAGIAHAAEAFNKAVGSFDHRVRPSGERLLRLGLDPDGRTMPDVQLIDQALRLPEGATRGEG